MNGEAVVRDFERDALSEDSHVRRKKLPVTESRASLARHPDDGFVLANPYPLRPGLCRAVRAITLAALPPPPAPRPRDILDRIELHVRVFMAYMHPLAARGFALSILLIDLAPIFLFQSFSRFRNLDGQRATKLLDEMVHGRFSFMRMLVVAVRGLALSAYFDQDEVHEAIEYEPLPFLKSRIARREELVSLRRGRLTGGVA
jgi:hypothetical protein